MEDYNQNYYQAVCNPLPELAETFVRETEFLKSLIDKEDIIIDFGCGMGRPARELSFHAKEIIALDNSLAMLDLAKEFCKGISNIAFKECDVLNTGYSDESFDVAYATYNLIGSIEEESRLLLVKEMARVTKPGGKVVIVTWKDDDSTTDFLERYYPSIGINIIFVDKRKTETNKGIFSRLSKKQLYDYCEEDLKNIFYKGLDPVWLAVVGNKK